jgi:ribosomal protein S18 acetylase RimI-like enzyme
VTADLYARERREWCDRLQWDTHTSWATVEQARATWGLPGFIVRDAAGAIRGWTFFILRHNRVEVGGLVADHVDATRALVEGLTAHAAQHDGLRGFVYTRAEGLDEILASHRVSVEAYCYLASGCDMVVTPPRALDAALERAARDGATLLDVRGWMPTDGESAARLLRDAYGERGALFAPRNELGEWREYVQNLVTQAACGVVSPALSRVVMLNGRMQALALVTTLAAGSAHVAQLVVDPALRRHGVAAGLMAEVAARAQRAAYSQLSLLVSSENRAATELYRGLGMAERGRFLALRQ